MGIFEPGKIRSKRIGLDEDDGKGSCLYHP